MYLIIGSIRYEGASSDAYILLVSGAYSFFQSNSFASGIIGKIVDINNFHLLVHRFCQVERTFLSPAQLLKVSLGVIPDFM